MVSTFTPNIRLEEPARGDDVGTWDTPVNNNSTLLDLVCGGIATISLGSGNVTLSAAQFQSATLTFNSTLIQNTVVTFPSSFTKPYTVGHLCTGSSAFTITLQTTAAGGQVIAIPPGEFIQVFNDGTNFRFMNLGRVGEYMDIATSTVPAWISACTVPPYLACIGGTFSSAAYPQLAVILGGTTLPDTRGRVRAALDAGTGRLNGVIAPGVGNAGGDQNMQVHSHANTATVNDSGHFHQLLIENSVGGFATAVGSNNAGALGNQNTTSVLTGITVTMNNVNAGLGSAQNVQPTYYGGITMIRAA